MPWSHMKNIFVKVLPFVIISFGLLWVLTFWLGLRLLDPYVWPHSGIARAKYGIASPTKAKSIGRDCFVKSGDWNLLDKLEGSEHSALMGRCAEQQEIVLTMTAPKYVKIIARCEDGENILERSVLQFRSTEAYPPDICTVALFRKDQDKGTGQMTLSSYEPDPPLCTH